MPSLTRLWVIGACGVLAVAASCSGSDGKKDVDRESAGGEAGAAQAGDGGARAGSNAGGKPQAGTAGTVNEGGAAGSSEGGASVEGGTTGLAGAGGEGATDGRAGAGGEAGGPTECCNPQVDYSAASGVLPSDQICSMWSLEGSTDPEVPSFVGNALRVASSADAENMYFLQSDAVLTFPQTFVFEARMKFVSGAGSTASRAPASMAFVYGPQHMKNMLQMSATEVFILDSENVKGDAITFDTTSDFHTYRIEVDTQANTFDVFIDDELELSGETYASNSNDFILFGESSIYAYGISEWQYVKHNAYRCTD